MKKTRHWPKLASLSAGGILATSMPELSWEGAVWAGLIPWFVALWLGQARDWSVKRRLRHGFVQGWLGGFVFFEISLSWLYQVSWVGGILMPMFLALYPACWGALVSAYANPRRWEWGKVVKQESELERKVRMRLEKTQMGRRRLFRLGTREAGISVACAIFAGMVWVIMEWARGWILTGFGWNGLGVAYYQNAPLSQVADLVGLTGLAFLPVFVNAVITDTSIRLYDEAKVGRLGPHLDFIAGCALIAAVFLYGNERMEHLKKVETHPVRALAIQRNTPQQMKWDKDYSGEIYRDYREATHEAFAAIRKEEEQAFREQKAWKLWQPDWVIWPESALPHPIYRTKDGAYLAQQINLDYVDREILTLREEFGSFVWMSGTNEWVGEMVDSDKIQYSHMHNALWVVDSGVASGRTWGKQHLVPFGEYLPFRDQMPWLEQLFESQAGFQMGENFARGQDREAMPVMAGTREIEVIPAICYEDSVPRLMRSFVRRGKAQVLLNITNDGWFGESAAPEQHFAHARFRAIELRRPLLRVANTGVTAAVSIIGELEESKHLEEGQRVLRNEAGSSFTKGALRATLEVPVDGELTLYARWGDWLVWPAAFYAIAFAIFSERSWRKASRGQNH